MRHNLLLAAVLVPLTLATSGALAQDEAAEAPLAELPAEPAESPDPAFDQYIDTDFLREAWAELHPGHLTDAGLQLAEGERVLFRSHRQITADAVLGAAVTLAAQKRDQATLKRLAEAAEALGKSKLAASVSTAMKLASAPRAAVAAPSIDLSKLSPDILVDYHDTMEEIDSARLLGDKKRLGELAQEIKAGPLPQELRAHLAATTAKSIQNAPTEVNSSFAALDKLQGESRGWKTYKFKNYGPVNVYVKVYRSGKSGYPKVYKVPAPPAPYVPVPFPSKSMYVRVKVSGGGYSPKFKIKWKSSYINVTP